MRPLTHPKAIDDDIGRAKRSAPSVKNFTAKSVISLFRNCNISGLAIPMIRCSLDVPGWAYFSQLLHAKEDAARRQAKIAPNIVATNNQNPD